MMVDGEIRLSTGSTIAAVLWGVTATLFVVLIVTSNWHFVAGTVLMGQVALAATIRQMLVRFGRTLRNGFELGRDSVTPLSRR